MVREVEVTLPRIAGQAGGTVRAIAFQDLPARAIGTYHAVAPALRGTVAMGLLSLAVGHSVDLEIYGYDELTRMAQRWKETSLALDDEENYTEWLPEVDWDEML